MGDRVRKMTRKDGRDQGARSGRHGVMEEGREDEPSVSVLSRTPIPIIFQDPISKHHHVRDWASTYEVEGTKHLVHCRN